MPRKYIREHCARSYKNYSAEDLMQAVEEISNGATYRSTSEKFNIPVGTLQKKKKNNHMGKVGRPKALTDEEELSIVAHLLVCAEWGFPLDQLELRMITRAYLNLRQKMCPQFVDNIPGKDFVAGFLDRHNNMLRMRSVPNYSRKRASLSSTVINQYFDNLEVTLRDVPKENIFNYDETNLTDNPGKKRCIIRRGTKYPQRVMNETKSAISLMLCGSAVGELLPPYVCYKSKAGLYNTWRIGGPKGARYGRSLSGWFDSQIFEDWFITIALPALKKKTGLKVLFGDNLASHFSPSVISLCRKNNIRFMCLPPNATDILQPLDVATFAPMKRLWRSLITAYKIDNPSESAVKKDKFPQLLKMLWNELLTTSAENLKNGFDLCLSREKIMAKYRFESSPADVNSLVGQAVIDALRERRFKGSLTTSRRTKVRCAPGTSMGNIDSESSEEEDDDDEEDDEDDDEEDDEEEEDSGLGLEGLSRDEPDTAAQMEEEEETDSLNDVEMREEEDLLTEREQEEAMLKNLEQEVDGRWMVAKFFTGRCFKNYIAKLIGLNDDWLEVLCLRKRKGAAQFYFPKQRDMSTINPEHVVKELQQPEKKSGYFSFKEDLKPFSVQ